MWKLMMRGGMQELMPGSSAEHGSSAKGSSTAQLKSWLSGLGKIGKADVEEVCLLSCMGTCTLPKSEKLSYLPSPLCLCDNEAGNASIPRWERVPPGRNAMPVAPIHAGLRAVIVWSCH